MSAPLPYVIGGTAEARRVVLATFESLPDDVQRALGPTVQVAIVRGAGARALPLPRAPGVQWLVVIAEPALTGLGGDGWVVAHELAHCLLDHRVAEGDGAAQQAQANGLAKAWGFE